MVPMQRRIDRDPQLHVPTANMIIDQSSTVHTSPTQYESIEDTQHHAADMHSAEDVYEKVE